MREKRERERYRSKIGGERGRDDTAGERERERKDREIRQGLQSSKRKQIHTSPYEFALS